MRMVHRLAGTALGTGWQVSFAGEPSAEPERLRAAIEARLTGIVAEMSQWEPTSCLSRFNRGAAGQWFALPPDLATVVAAALAVAARSEGAFDPSHGRAAALLGFGAEPVAGPPSPEQLADAQTKAGWQRLRFDRAARRLCQPGGLWLDLSGIAKGFAVDAVADLLAIHGHPDALVEIGGELAGRGLRADGQPWWVALEAVPGLATPPLRIGLHELAVATSGDYRRGRHTLDPRTGRPTPATVAAVSVVAATAMLADAWATALAVLGPDDGMALARREGLAARMVVREGPVERISPALAAMMEE